MFKNVGKTFKNNPLNERIAPLKHFSLKNISFKSCTRRATHFGFEIRKGEG